MLRYGITLFETIWASYPHGSGYCRVVFTQIQKKGKARDFKETACKDVSYRGWQFIRYIKVNI